MTDPELDDAIEYAAGVANNLTNSDTIRQHARQLLAALRDEKEQRALLTAAKGRLHDDTDPGAMQPPTGRALRE